jgi:D-alanine-D-alanine ligase-like ATP-grasp enzyme
MQKKIKRKKFCQDCGMPSTYHIQTWIEELVDYLFLSPVLNFLPRKLEVLLDILIEKFFVLSRLVSPRDDFAASDILPRTACFINEARKHGIKFRVLRGPFGYTNHFQMQTRKKIFHFEGLPRAEFLNKYGEHIVGDKEITKQHLKKGNFPVAPGKSFWFFQKKKARRYGANQLGFPLVVKPRGGSVSRHVTTNIESIKQLKYAINKSIIYLSQILLSTEPQL